MLDEMSRQSDYVKTALRLPRDLHRKLLAVAAENERSLNAELLERLAASFVRDSVEERLSALEKALKKR
jgi:predicted HicB family RNase H-like nuclease